MNAKQFLVMTIGVLIVSYSTCAQVSFQTAPPSCDSSYYASTYKVAFQTTNPPIYPSTPISVILAYLAMDSVSKHSNWTNASDFIVRQTTYNDTVRKILRHWYEAVDYNPFAYLAYTDDKDSNRRVDAAKLMGVFKTTLNRVSSTRIEDILLCGNEIIVKGTVTSIVNDHSDSVLTRRNTTTATISIIDTIKGRVLPLHFCSGAIADRKSDGALEQTSTAYNCLNIEFRAHLFSKLQQIAPNLDSSFYEIPAVGDTCYFFLSAKHVAVCTDGMYFGLMPIHQPVNLGVYRIVNGHIKTPNLEFTGLPYPAESTFINCVTQHINRIKSY